MHTIAIRSYSRSAAGFMVLLAGLLILPETTFALPRFALQSGQRCASCHVNISGGGQRTEGGWWSMKSVGLINPKGTFLDPLYGADDNTLFVPQVSWGFDYRAQVARRGRDLERQFFSMQLAPYVTYKPMENLSVYAAYNIVEPEYAAQQHWYGGVTYQPIEELALKAGYIQPNFGVRHDDHTTFTRIHGGATLTEGIGYVPYYAEWGGEAYITPIEWLTVSGGLYSAASRHEIVPQVDSSRMFYTAGLNIVYPDFDNNMNFEIGASLAQYNEQTLIGGHAGFSIIDRGSLLFEYVRKQDDFQRFTNPSIPTSATYFQNANVFLVKASVELIEGLAFVARWEQARSENIDFSDGSDETHYIEKQWVAGFQAFVLPNLELRPEYRWTDTPYYRVGQYTVQLHVFY